MGWTVLYVAFGIVALWLLGEVLLQYKARLRWRLVAFFGFLTVVLGVLMPSVPVIGAGAIAFALGQTYVTLSFRSGFSSGWAIPNPPAWARRREDEYDDEAYDGPYDDAYAARDERGNEQPEHRPEPEPAAAPAARGPETDGGVFTPQPMPDETGQYGVYDENAHAAAGQGQPDGYDGYPGHTGYTEGGFDPYGQDLHAAAQHGYGQDGYDPYGQQAGTDQGIYTGQDAYAGYGYDTGQYAAQADPYGGQGYDPYAGYHQGYDTGQYAADPYQQHGSDTPPGGVWVPQQREGEQYPGEQQEQPYPYQQQAGYEDYGTYETYGTGYDGQYRY